VHPAGVVTGTTGLETTGRLIGPGLCSVATADKQIGIFFPQTPKALRSGIAQLRGAPQSFGDETVNGL